MNVLIEKLHEYATKMPDKPALMKNSGKEIITFGELDDLTGRIYAWLKERRIGREDMIMIYLPREVQIYVCLLGILKAGAAFTVLEDTIPEERKKYIEKDAKCRLVIDTRLYEEMIAGRSVPGWESPDLHDACYAVYTSGSTGVPKGVLHEYGQIEKALSSFPYVRVSENNDDVCAFVSPLNFIAAYDLFYGAFSKGFCSLIADYNCVKDPEVFCDFLKRHKVTHTNITASLLKNLKNIPPCVKQIFIGGEPAIDVYVEGIEVINVYACSESGFFVSNFVIDKRYSLTPVGKNHCGVEIQLLDKNGKKTDRGEICFQNPFCRGYIGHPELNSIAFRDGLYHTGDEGYFTEKGDLVVCGRLDEMIKIRGNRLEPGEVEAVIRKVLRTDTVVVKKDTQGGREFLIAFVQSIGDKEKENGGYIKAEMKKSLPDYMIPSYFVFLDRFPMLPSGKIDKKALVVPVTVSLAKAADVPRDETEAYLCGLFEKALSIENVGINDDFFDLGGDSLTAMKMIAGCVLKKISVSDLYELRTPAKMAEHYRMLNISEDDLESGRKRAMLKPQPALLETQTVFEVQKYAPQSTMWNLSFLMQLKKDVDAERLSKAVDRVLKHHPVFLSVFFIEDGRLMQKYKPELYENIKIVHTTEAEFSVMQKKLVGSFETLTDVLLYRKAIFVTEKRALFFFDIHHSITDGTSLLNLWNQICACYMEPEKVLPEDYYYLILEDFDKQIGNYRDKNNEVCLYYRKLSEKYLSDKNFLIPVMPDNDKDESMRRGVCKTTTDITKQSVQSFLTRRRLTENEFFTTACLLAIAKYNKREKSMLLFVHSGRDDAMRASSCGLLLHSISLFADIAEKRSLSDLFDDIKSQEEYGAAHGNFNITYFIEKTFELSLYFIYQKDIVRTGHYPMVERQLELEPPNAADSLIEFWLIDNTGEEKYAIEAAYSSSNYKAESIRRFIEIYTDIVKAIVMEDDPDNCQVSKMLKKIR